MQADITTIETGLTALEADVATAEAEIAGIKNQNILWQGASYLNAQQTFTLSESVSAQTNGIVFVWSHYDNSTSTAHNYEWVSIFVPKSLVALHSNTGHRMSFLTDVGVLVSKYVYITNTTMTGHEKNSQQLTSNGRAIDNRKAVLRYVIGV